jgi:hypothetical protein
MDQLGFSIFTTTGVPLCFSFSHQWNEGAILGSPISQFHDKTPSTHLVSKTKQINKQTQKEKGYAFDLIVIVRETEGKENEN